jgi:hypothetical protein
LRMAMEPQASCFSAIMLATKVRNRRIRESCYG